MSKDFPTNLSKRKLVATTAFFEVDSCWTITNLWQVKINRFWGRTTTKVKTRKVNSLNLVDATNPEEQINIRKIDKLQKIAETYIDENDLWESDWQFDAISVIFYSDSEKPKIEHLENIFF